MILRPSGRGTYDICTGFSPAFLVCLRHLFAAMVHPRKLPHYISPLFLSLCRHHTCTALPCPSCAGRNNGPAERQLPARALHLSGLCRGYVCPAPRMQPLTLAPIEILNPNPPTYRLSRLPGTSFFNALKLAWNLYNSRTL